MSSIAPFVIFVTLSLVALAIGEIYIATRAENDFSFGEKGQKGQKGESDMNGGGPGTKGQKGTKGETGVDGPKGVDGSNGTKGEMGNDGKDGPKGEKGMSGSASSKGNKGDIGPKGNTGATGSGTKGEKGEIGPVGSDGKDGATGDKGNKGEIGSGDKGEAGTDGKDGSKGATGAAGTDGTNGTDGDKGNKGEVGATGSGSKGQKGEVGVSGSDGADGDKGATGAAGTDGTNGTNGDKGATGAAGTDGTNGTNGDKGDKGEVGATGSGSKGQKGEVGVTGSNGDKGATGAAGTDGTDGTDGSKGQKGEVGAAGSDGANGTDGSKGQKGIKGIVGPKGMKGQKGEEVKGEKGDVGPIGIKGIKGVPGPKGQKGGGDTPLVEVLVKTSSDLSGSLSSQKLYRIDGDIDMGNTFITVPFGGINIAGFSKRTCRLRTSVAGLTLFVSSNGGSGNMVITDLTIVVNGAGSQVYDLKTPSGTESFEASNVIYAMCSSLGTLDNFYVGAESTVVRFGGTPTLTLAGVWYGYSLNFCIVASLDSGMTGNIFNVGTGLLFNGRFTTNMTVDLPTNGSFTNFATGNFNMSSSFRLNGAKFSRNGALPLETETNIMTAITHSDIKSNWLECDGITNTRVGGAMGITTEVTTVIPAVSTYTPVLGTWTTNNLQHFSMGTNGQLLYLGSFPNEFRVFFDGVISGGSNDVISIRVMRYQASTASSIEVTEQTRIVNNLLGVDRAFYNIFARFSMFENDYVYLEVSNNTDATNITLLIDSFVDISS